MIVTVSNRSQKIYVWQKACRCIKQARSYCLFAGWHPLNIQSHNRLQDVGFRIDSHPVNRINGGRIKNQKVKNYT
jgi:hypothetical protein